jgi:hypothetical protein
MPLHPAWVKNISRRVLWAAFDRDLTRPERQEMAKFFDNRCAYCGGSLSLRWHADHVISVDNGGSNHISNRVPSCAKCNEDEKQERDWLEFLTAKCGEDKCLLGLKTDKIVAWRNAHSFSAVEITDTQRAAWKEEVAILAAAIDLAWERLRNLRKR